jgi:S-adenosylmethionine decarboxylase
MEDLAPDIVRQRLLIEGFYELDIDAAVIESYFGRLCDGLGLQAYGNPTLFSPAGKGQEINQGYDAFLPLVDSGVSLYAWTARRFLAVVLFTCKRFDAARAVELTAAFFRMSRSAVREF